MVCEREKGGGRVKKESNKNSIDQYEDGVKDRTEAAGQKSGAFRK